ncbi:uncharacterized protein [Dermacentor albipictus]|uniref:uncharacterized protein isoform X2 n=1 Tax=Dermacentor albipictus TaxID=60249 RepID=UPI0038FC53B3
MSSALGPINSAPHPSVFSGHGESAAGKVLKMLRLSWYRVLQIFLQKSWIGSWHLSFEAVFWRRRFMYVNYEFTLLVWDLR